MRKSPPDPGDIPLTRNEEPDIVFCRAFSVCISKRAKVLVGSGTSEVDEEDTVVGSEGEMIVLSIPDPSVDEAGDDTRLE